jgi:hypothetical protein
MAKSCERHASLLEILSLRKGFTLLATRKGRGSPHSLHNYTRSHSWVTQGTGDPMKPFKIHLVLLISLLLTATAIAPSHSGVKIKNAGRTASSIPNTILSGKGGPINTLGINGDFYIDTRTLSFYGPKKSGKWPAAQSLQGAAGVDGSNGKNGSDGKSTVNASNNAGATGPQGEKGEAGLQGAPGSAGASGLPGAPGAAGAQGLKGEPGTSGGGTPGAKGDTGSPGADGEDGADGVKGETGTVGSTGPSSVYSRIIPGWTLSTDAALTFSSSSFFETFTAGTAYKFTIILHGVSNLQLGTFGCNLILSDASSPVFDYSMSEYRFVSGGLTKYRYTFTIEGALNVGSSDLGLSIRITDGKGETGSDPVVFAGTIFKTLVGSVSAL